jgi:hypothetical protein
VTRARPQRRLTADEHEMISILFEPGERESAIFQLRQAASPAPARFRASLARTIETRLVRQISRFLHRLLASDRGDQSEEFDAADDLRATAEHIAQALRLDEGAEMSGETAAELADDLERAWLRFSAEAAAYRMHTDFLRLDATLSRSNDARRADAEAGAMEKFIAWRSQRYLQRPPSAVTPSIDHEVRLYKNSKKIPDREYRRLRQLLKAGRLDTSEK